MPIDVGNGRRIGPTHVNVRAPNRSPGAQRLQHRLPPSNVSVGPESRTSATAESVARRQIRDANQARRAANQAARASRRVPPRSIPHLSPTLGALQQQTHSELIDHAGSSDEALVKVLHHLSGGTPEPAAPKVPSARAEEPKLHLTPDQRQAARSLTKSLKGGRISLSHNPAGRRYSRDVAVQKYKQDQPLSFREQARAERTLIRRGKTDKLRPQDRAIAQTPFGPGRGQVEAQVRAQRQGARLTSKQDTGGGTLGDVGRALDKVKNEGVLGALGAHGLAASGRKVIYGTENPSTVQLGVDLGLTLAGGRVLGRVAEAGGPVLGRTLGKVLGRGGAREGLSVVEKAKYAATRAAAAEAGVELAGSRAGKVARSLKEAEKVGSVSGGPSRLGTATQAGTKVAGALGIGGVGKGVASRLAEGGSGEKALGRKILSTLRHNAGKATLAAGPAAQIPAVVSTGDPTQFGKAFTGKGAVIGAITKTAGDTAGKVVPAGIARNLVQDVFSLPAQALPSVYLPIAGLVEASRGDPARLKKLWADYKKVGLLPAVASGNPKKVLDAIVAHPLFSALEASGVYAGVGRGAGALGRAGGSRAAGTGGRAPLEISPGMEPVERPYSKNVITKAIQVARDKRNTLSPEGHVRAGSRHGLRGPERDRMLRDRVTSFVGGNEAGRRAGRADVYKTAQADIKPKDVPKAAEDVVSEVGQHFVLGTDVPTFRRTALARADSLDTIYRERTDPSLPAGERFLKTQATLNRKLAGDLRSAAKLPDEKVQRILESAKTFQAEHSAHSAATQELIARNPEQITHEQARRRGLFPYAMTHEGHTFGLSNETKARIAELKAKGEGNSSEAASLRGNEQLLDPSGKPADYNALEQHLRDQGLESPAYLSHREGMRGPAAHYQPIMDRGQIGRHRTTGKAGQEGTYDASFAAVEDQLAHTFTTTHRARSFDGIVTRFGVTGKHPETGKTYFPTSSKNDASRINDDPAYAKDVYGMDIPAGERVVGIRLTPLFARARSAAGVKDLITEAKGLNEEHPAGLNPDTGAAAAQTELERWNEAASGKGDGPYAYIPEIVKKEIDAHLAQRSSLGKLFETYNSGFKSVVLPTSAKWLEANTIEAAMRSVFSGVTPLDYMMGKQGFNLIEDMFGHDARVQFQADITPGAHFASRKFTRKFRTSEQVAGSSEEPVFRLFEAAARAPTVRTALRIYNGYAKAIFGLNTFLETQPQIGAFGKYLKDELHRNNVDWGRGMDAHRDAIAALLSGKEGPGGEFQYRAAKSVQNIYGNWSHNTPRARRILADYTPFGMWLRAATKYVFWTLPRHHPIKTAILASLEEMTQNEREKMGLDVFHSAGNGALPVDSFGLPGPIHVGPINVPTGGVLPTTYFTSFGTAQQALSVSGAGDFVLPQFSQLLSGNVDWKGDQLVHLNGTPLSPLESAVTIAAKTIEPMVPFSSVIRQIREHGGSPTPSSNVFFPQVRPGSKRSGRLPQRIAGVNPLSPSTVGYLRQKNKQRTISVPATASKGSSSDPFSHLFGGGSSNNSPSDPFSHLFK